MVRVWNLNRLPCPTVASNAASASREHGALRAAHEQNGTREVLQEGD